MPNAAVGTLYKGYPILDRADFEANVTERLRATGGFNGLNGYNSAVSVPGNYGLNTQGAVFWLYNFDATPYRDAQIGSGEDFVSGEVWHRDTLAAAYSRALDVPTVRFLYFGPRAGFKDPAKDLVKVLYVRYKDVMVPIAAMLVYSASDWVGWRGGIEFVAAGAFAAVVAPFISGELAALVSGTSTTVEVGATQASLVSSFSSSASQLSGNQNVALVGKLVNAYNGSASGIVGPDESLAETARLTSYAQGNTQMWDAFDFTSGESDVALSDASTWDLGFAGAGGFSDYDASGLDINGFGAATLGDPSFGTGVYDYNTTPEVTTNAYGTVFEPQFTADESAAESARLTRDENMAKITPAAAAQTALGQIGKAASSGTASAKNAQPASNDILSTLGRTMNGVVSAVGSLSQASQILTNADGHAGQLTPQGGASGSTIAGIPTNYLMIGAVVLVGVAILMHSKG